MPLILNRDQVLGVYDDAGKRGWVIPAFNSENLTTTESILQAALDYGHTINKPDIPITIGITNNYSHRSQSVNYTHTRKWDIGLRLFLSDIEVLTGKGSPYEDINVMILLDHIQWDTDIDLLKWDMGKFSMIMFDASTLPFEENIRLTNRFVEENRSRIVIEGACDEIMDATGDVRNDLTSPEQAVDFLTRTNVDYLVVNLGTEHRATSKNLKYHDDLAKQISRLTGKRLVLHGTSSVAEDQIGNLYSDGIAKVNIWTTLERDTSPVLFEQMVRNASKITGKKKTEALITAGMLGPAADRVNEASLSHYTTMYRQDIIFDEMKKIVLKYLTLWYT